MAKRRAAGKTAARSRPAARTRTTKKEAPARRASKRPAGAAARSRPATASALFGTVKGADGREIGHVRLDVGRAGSARVKRMIYPPGFKWSVDMKPVTGTELCMHAHVGFLAHGEIHIEYANGEVVEFRAPQVVAIDPGHDGWVVGREPVVLIEFDFERDTIAKLGMPQSH